MNILPESRKKIFQEVCSQNNLVPCVFPIDVKTLTPLGKGWNLFNLLTNEPINPITLATDEKVPMSEWEFNNFAIFQVMPFIDKQGLKIHSFCDTPGITPQIWFQDKMGRTAWIIVKYAMYPTKAQDIIIENVEQVASTISAYDGYIARIAFMPIEKGNCYRKSGFYVSFNGLEKVYIART